MVLPSATALNVVVDYAKLCFHRKKYFVIIMSRVLEANRTFPLPFPPPSPSCFSLPENSSKQINGSYVCYYQQPEEFAPLSMLCAVGSCLYEVKRNKSDTKALRVKKKSGGEFHVILLSCGVTPRFLSPTVSGVSREY